MSCGVTVWRATNQMNIQYSYTIETNERAKRINERAQRKERKNERNERWKEKNTRHKIFRIRRKLTHERKYKQTEPTTILCLLAGVCWILKLHKHFPIHTNLQTNQKTNELNLNVLCVIFFDYYYYALNTFDTLGVLLFSSVIQLILSFSYTLNNN